MAETIVIASRFGKGITVVVAAVCAIGIGSTVITAPDETLRVVPWLLLLGVGCWALYWNPAVIIGEQAVQFRNIVRTVEIPYAAITGVDTRFALTVNALGKRYSAWGAPAASRWSVTRARREDVEHLPETTYVEGGIRPGDLLRSDSGQAAYLIRERQLAVHESAADSPPVVVRWQRAVTVTLATLLALALLVALLR